MNDSISPPNSHGWFKATRGNDSLELIRSNRCAFLLAYIIATRARWSPGYNQHGLVRGEAFLGDYTTCGMTRQEYRTAKQHLEKWGFATFKSTNRGTVARLLDTRLFDVVNEPSNQQMNQRSTSSQPSGNHKQEGKEGKTPFAKPKDHFESQSNESNPNTEAFMKLRKERGIRAERTLKKLYALSDNEAVEQSADIDTGEEEEVEL